GEQLEFSVAVREVREHEERQPVRAWLVECAEDARPIGVAAASLEERLRFLAPVAPEMRVQEVRHGPEVSALFDVDLEEVAQVVEARARVTEGALLLDARGLGVALGHDEAAQRVAML